MNLYGTNRVIEKGAETRRGGIKAKQNLLQKLLFFLLQMIQKILYLHMKKK